MTQDETFHISETIEKNFSLVIDDNVIEMAIRCPHLGFAYLNNSLEIVNTARPLLLYDRLPELKESLLSTSEKAFSTPFVEGLPLAEIIEKRVAAKNVPLKFGNFKSLADFLIPTFDNEWELTVLLPCISVKYTESLSAAWVAYVASGSGLKISRVNLFYLDKRNKYTEPADPHTLYRKESLHNLPMWYKKVEKMISKLLKSESENSAGVNYDARKCSGCLLKPTCSTLENGGDSEATENSFSTTHLKPITIEETSCLVDPVPLLKWISQIEYPIYFLDFEAFQTPLPFWPGLAPFERLPFQYSLHIQKKENGKVTHKEFLYKWSKINPRESFIKSLKKELGTKGTILAFNAAFEKKVLFDCGDENPEYLKWVEELESRFVDLWLPFNKHYIYHPKQGRRSSLKVITPLFTDLNYKDLDIAEGYDASLYFINTKYTGRNKEVEKNLLKYCAKDTLTMVSIFNTLNKVKAKLNEPD